MDHDRFVEHIVTWAAADNSIRVVVLTGSVAMGPGHVHALSDLDVELYVKQPATLLDHDAWYGEFGEILVVEALPNPGWHPTRLVYYVDGKIDFMIGPVGALETTRYMRPFRVLLDKDHATDTFTAASPLETLPPNEASLRECTHWTLAKRSDGRQSEMAAMPRRRNRQAEWMTEELPFRAADRPSERATIFVAETPDLVYDSVGEVVIAPPSLLQP